MVAKIITSWPLRAWNIYQKTFLFGHTVRAGWPRNATLCARYGRFAVVRARHLISQNEKE